MAFLRTGLSAGALLVSVAAWSQAQSTRGRAIVEPQSQPRIAGIAPPPALQRPSPRYGPTVFANYPVVVTPDGQVFVDLGYGFEEVVRACPDVNGYGCQSSGQPTDSQRTVFPSYIAPSYEGPHYEPPIYQAPVYPASPNPAGVYTGSVIATDRGYTRSGYVAQSNATRPTPGQSPPTRLVAVPKASSGPIVVPRHTSIHR